MRSERHRVWRRSCRVAALLVFALIPAALGACGTEATDANEPNDELNSATALVPATPTGGLIATDDSDIFQCEAPNGDGARSFIVTVLTDSPKSIELQVGASIPGAPEGISWPGWKPVQESDGVRLTGELGEGTVLMFLSGPSGTRYSIEIVWQ